MVYPRFLAALVALVFASPSFAGTFFTSPTISTATNKTQQYVSGVMGVAKDTMTYTTYTVLMDGSTGVRVSTITPIVLSSTGGYINLTANGTPPPCVRGRFYLDSVGALKVCNTTGGSFVYITTSTTSGIPAGVAVLVASQTFSGINTFISSTTLSSATLVTGDLRATNGGNVLAGSGAAITGVTASSVAAAGVLPGSLGSSVIASSLAVNSAYPASLLTGSTYTVGGIVTSQHIGTLGVPLVIASTGGAAVGITLQGANGTLGSNGGGISLIGGNDGNSSGAQGGAILIQGGDAQFATDLGGNVTIKGGTCTACGGGGSVILQQGPLGGTILMKDINNANQFTMASNGQITLLSTLFAGNLGAGIDSISTSSGIVVAGGGELRGTGHITGFDFPAANILAGSLGSGVIASSLAVNSVYAAAISTLSTNVALTDRVNQTFSGKNTFTSSVTVRADTLITAAHPNFYITDTNTASPLPYFAISTAGASTPLFNISYAPDTLTFGVPGGHTAMDFIIGAPAGGGVYMRGLNVGIGDYPTHALDDSGDLEVSGASTFQSSVTVNATLYAVSHTGSGAALTGVTASSVAAAGVTAGSLPSTVIASSIAVNAVTVNSIADASVTNAKLAASGLDASKLTTGTLGTGVTINLAGQTYSGSLSGSNVSGGTFGAVNGSALTNLSGSAVSGGTFGAVNGSALTNLTAANISAGNLGASVLASSIPASIAVGTMSINGSTTAYVAPSFGISVTTSADCGTLNAAGELISGTVTGDCYYPAINLTGTLTVTSGYAMLHVAGQATINQAVTVNVVFNTGGMGGRTRSVTSTDCSTGMNGWGYGAGKAMSVCNTVAGAFTTAVTISTSQPYSPFVWKMGSSGGGGGTRGNSADEKGGDGGDAGGGFWVVAHGSITVTGAITANGGAGTIGIGASSGGGGGSGGTIGLVSWSAINISGTQTASGGVGGNSPSAGGSGGGGGGGQVVLMAPSITNTATIVVSGGAGGVGSSNANQTSAGAGGSNGGPGGTTGVQEGTNTRDMDTPGGTGRVFTSLVVPWNF